MTKRWKTIALFVLASLIFQPVFWARGQNSYILNEEIKDINNDISSVRSQIKRLEDRQKEYADAIKQKQNEKVSLANQLSILDNRVAKAELDIEMTQTDIKKNKLEIRKTDLEIENKSKEISRETEHLENILRLMQKKENVSTLEIILLNDSLSDFMGQVRYLENVNESIKESLNGLKVMKRQIERQRDILGSQRSDLQELEKELIDRKKKLENEKETKINVLSQVNQSETEYQRLLGLAKKEQQDAENEIVMLERVVRLKLSQLSGDDLEFNDNGLIWPVTKNIITAYFRDPSYPFRHIFEHPAVDIRAAQGTTLKAAASGYVARVKFDGSSNYGYIMIIHGDGISTVYGHVSRAYIKEDEYVIQGQKIGLTGGLPGTAGAGRLSTGPHLHFEVRLNGIPVDPLAYLP